MDASTSLQKLAYVTAATWRVKHTELTAPFTSPRVRGEVGTCAQARVTGEGDLRALCITSAAANGLSPQPSPRNAG
jgi:hypothetical protein